MRCSLRNTPDPNVTFQQFDPLTPFFRLQSRAAVRFPPSRLATQAVFCLIIVCQRGKGHCNSVRGVKSGGDISVKASNQKESAEQQLPVSMSGALPEELAAVINADAAGLGFRISDSAAGAGAGDREGFAKFEDLYIATMNVSLHAWRVPVTFEL